MSRELPEHSEEYELHHFLGTLLSDVLSMEKKLDIINAEYHIPVRDVMRKDVNIMCNLGEGIFERGMAQGIEVGIMNGIESVIVNMHKKGYPLGLIADAVEKDVKEVEAVIEKKSLVTS